MNGKCVYSIPRVNDVFNLLHYKSYDKNFLIFITILKNIIIQIFNKLHLHVIMIHFCCVVDRMNCISYLSNELEIYYFNLSKKNYNCKNFIMLFKKNKNVFRMLK